MPKLSKKNRDMWKFFIDPKTGKRRYNSLCIRCGRGCKQSFRVRIIECPKHTKKHRKRNSASERRKNDG